jgi:hypothetical protein
VPSSPNNPTEANAAARESLLSVKRALFVGAHPDDIEFRAGGLVHVMRQRGVEVTFAVATRGGKGLPAPLRRPLERLRTRHQMRSAEILGGVEVILCDYPDGALPDFVGPFAEDLRSLILSRQPDVVLSWDPDFIFNHHPDHQAAADAARAASVGVTMCFYGTMRPNLWVGLDEESVAAKIRALKAHRTETPWFYFDLRLKKRLIAGMAAEGAKIGRDYAETFRTA